VAATAQAEDPSTSVEIVVEDLHKAFDEHVVLRSVSLQIRQGEVVAIVGGSGCGKTVLLNEILGLLEADQGRVLTANHSFADAPLVDLSEATQQELEQIHAHWGVVFQRNALFSGSVYDNMALSLDEVKHLEERDIDAVLKRALDAVGLPSDETFLTLDHESLSGGMAKRLALARALAMDPMVLFYDEPTTGLDPTSAAQIQTLIHATHQNTVSGVRTTVIITHDKDLLIRLRPRTVMLHDGLIFFDGPFEEFSASDSPTIRPYFDIMPILHRRAEAAESSAVPG
jgi:phospholipid/cholesterol/gamma-HCH transport system ATP-binding protein